MINLEKGQRILFVGDSITDCGRREDPEGLGDGYVRLFRDLLASRSPDMDLQFVNRGIGGDKVTNLAERWQQDVVDENPDHLIVYIGINDVHSFLSDDADAVSSDLFARTYDELLKTTREKLNLKSLTLVSPFYLVKPEKATAWESSVLKALEEYIEVAQNLAKTYEAGWVPLHTHFQNMLKHATPSRYAPEPIHPNQTGHLAIAVAIYGMMLPEED